MGPAAQSTDADMATILNALASCDEFPLNSKTFAASEGISRSDNAVTKFKRILKNFGYKYEKQKVTKIDSNDSGANLAVETPKKAAAVKKPRTKAAPKKRKLKDDGDLGEEVKEDAANLGKVKNADDGIAVD